MQRRRSREFPTALRREAIRLYAEERKGAKAIHDAIESRVNAGEWADEHDWIGTPRPPSQRAIAGWIQAEVGRTTGDRDAWRLRDADLEDARAVLEVIRYLAESGRLAGRAPYGWPSRELARYIAKLGRLMPQLDAAEVHRVALRLLEASGDEQRTRDWELAVAFAPWRSKTDRVAWQPFAGTVDGPRMGTWKESAS